MPPLSRIGSLSRLTSLALACLGEVDKWRMDMFAEDDICEGEAIPSYPLARDSIRNLVEYADAGWELLSQWDRELTLANDTLITAATITGTSAHNVALRLADRVAVVLVGIGTISLPGSERSGYVDPKGLGQRWIMRDLSPEIDNSADRAVPPEQVLRQLLETCKKRLNDIKESDIELLEQLIKREHIVAGHRAQGQRRTGVRLSAAERDIIEVIQTAGKRMTTRQIMAALEKKRGAVSEGTTKSALAGLVRRHLLVNRQDVIPKGYGLADSE
jgi:hypothetical protein